MKGSLLCLLISDGFLSDLCGREVKQGRPRKTKIFSDLCGREDNGNFDSFGTPFLSDLCGREVLSGNGEVIVLFLSDLCGREDQ